LVVYACEREGAEQERHERLDAAGDGEAEGDVAGGAAEGGAGAVAVGLEGEARRDVAAVGAANGAPLADAAELAGDAIVVEGAPELADDPRPRLVRDGGR